MDDSHQDSAGVVGDAWGEEGRSQPSCPHSGPVQGFVLQGSRIVGLYSLYCKTILTGQALVKAHRNPKATTNTCQGTSLELRCEAVRIEICLPQLRSVGPLVFVFWVVGLRVDNSIREADS